MISILEQPPVMTANKGGGMNSCTPLMLKSSSFGEVTATHSPYLHRMCMNPLGQILTQNRCPSTLLDSRPDRSLPDPNLTPISIPVTIRAPYFNYPVPDSRTSFSICPERTISEGETIGSFLDGLFMDVVTSSRNPVQQESLVLAMALAHERDGVVFTMSSHGRLFEIPRETAIKDVVAGARWPRQSNAPVFEDLRQAPRKRTDEIDGIKLTMIEVYVVPKDKLGEL